MNILKFLTYLANMKQVEKLILGMGIGALLFIAYKKLFSGMKISDQGIEFLKGVEGIKNKAYKDTKGYWTIGIGHKIILPYESILLNKVLSDSEIIDLLKKDLIKFENAVNDSITVPLKQSEFDSLVSLAFNIGDFAFKNSSLVKNINSKNGKDNILKAFALWNKPLEVIGRRAKEIRLFNSGDYSNQLATKELSKYFI